MSVVTLWALFVLLPALNSAAGLAFFTFVISGVSMLIYCFGKDPHDEGVMRLHLICAKIYKPFAVATVALLLVGMLAPSERQIYTIAGAYVVTNTEGVERLPANMVKAANAFLERVADAAENK